MLIVPIVAIEFADHFMGQSGTTDLFVCFFCGQFKLSFINGIRNYIDLFLII